VSVRCSVSASGILIVWLGIGSGIGNLGIG
jgi:hypothetical protein